MKKLFLFSSGMLSVFFMSCTPNEPNPTNTVNAVDIYVAGSNQGKAAYWKNDVPTNLTDGTHLADGNAVVVVGNDVYVAGYETKTVLVSNPVGGNTPIEAKEAKYWKNGVAVNLTTATTTDYIDSEAKSIKVVGNDVYVCGNDGSETAVYWKNGVKTVLSTGNRDQANEIEVVGSDVYVAGAAGQGTSAAYWKNGVQTILSDQFGSYATSIAISGTDVYVAGVIQGNPIEGTTDKAVYWKNGLETILNTNGDARSIAVVGNDIYVSGTVSLGSNGSSTASYWKNGVAINLSTAPSTGDSIAFLNNVVYVAGTTSGVTTNATAWINGVQTSAGASTIGNSIFVVEQNN